MKKVMNNYYVHKSNWLELVGVLTPYEVLTLTRVMYDYKGKFNYEVIKFDTYNHKISFIDSPDWNSANEPIVGDCYIYDIAAETISFRKGRTKNLQIYHNKWMFVAEDYTGFDIQKAKERSELWNSIPNIKQYKSKIGNRDYWIELLTANGMEV